MWVKKVKLREPCLKPQAAEGQSWRVNRFCHYLWCRNCQPRPRWGGPGIAAGRAVSKGGVRVFGPTDSMGPTWKWLEPCLPVCSLWSQRKEELGALCPSPACSLGHSGSRAHLTRPHTHTFFLRVVTDYVNSHMGSFLTVCQNIM